MSKMLVKQPGESRVYSIVFAQNMVLGESIVGVNALSCSPAGLVFGTALMVNQELQFRLSGGVDRESYSIKASVSTSLGNILEHDVILLVRDQI
jgi:hypothetical protein